MTYEIEVKRIYESPHPEDGRRILVDRLWPRGLTKDAAGIDEWMKEVAPSTDLCRWFGHQPERFPEFRRQYEQQLASDPVHSELVERLCQYAKAGKVTLLYASKDPVHNQAVVLRDWLVDKLDLARNR